MVERCVAVVQAKHFFFFFFRYVTTRYLTTRGEIDLVSYHGPMWVFPLFQRAVWARPLKAPPPINRRDQPRPHRRPLHAREPVRLSPWDDDNRMRLALCNVLHYVANHDRRGEAITERPIESTWAQRHVLGEYVYTR